MCPALFYRLLPSVTLAINGLRLGDGGAFEKRLPTFCTKAK